MSRLKDNLEILERLRQHVETFEDQRFGQILRNSGVIVDYRDEEDGITKWANHFNEEPSETIQRMEKYKQGFVNFFTKPKRTKK